MIGVLGGTFDPIHFGHLRTALEVQEALGLAEVRFVPLRVAPHRPPPLATPEQRLAMVRAAVAGATGFVADDRELRREGRSFTYDTLRSLRAELGTAVPLCLILGGDAFADFYTWHRPDDILELAHLVVMERPNTARPADPRLVHLISERSTRETERLRAAAGGAVFFQRVTQLEISASKIRRLIADGLNPRFLTPEAVLEIMGDERLYRCQTLR